MLQAHGLAKRYGTLEVFRDLSLTLASHEAVALIGPSGAGKSTLLQLLGTLDRPDAGSVVFEGQRVDTLSRAAQAQFRQRHLGFVFQFHHLLVDFTACENVAMPLRLAGTGKAEAHRQAAELLGSLGLADRLAHFPAQLSGGEQQRVAIARALIGRPRLLLADEPTGNLDAANTDRLFDLLHDQARRHGVALLIATHNRAAASRLDRVLELSAGRLTELTP